MDIPKVYWKDIGGYSHVKDEIKKVTEWPLKHPEAFTRMGIAPSKGKNFIYKIRVRGGGDIN